MAKGRAAAGRYGGDTERRSRRSHGDVERALEAVVATLTILREAEAAYGD